MSNPQKSLIIVLLLLITGLGAAYMMSRPPQTATPMSDGSERVRVTFTGGHQTAPVDRGRPVKLIAAALGVPDETFRRAFSGVRPAKGRGPTGEEARRNKEALMSVLGPLGITNDRLDEVSNYYRYRPQAGELWPVEDAVAFAIINDGRVIRFEIEAGGSGYSSPPRAIIPGLEGQAIKVAISYGKDFTTNGSVTSLEPAAE